MLRKYMAFVVMFACVGLAGCATDLTSTAYSRKEARVVQTIQEGKVIELSAVTIDGTQTGIGGVAAGAAGGIAAGSMIGGGNGSDIASIGGAVLGGILGNLAEEKLTRKQGVNLTIRLKSGKMISVIQQVDPKMIFQVGDQVRVYTQSGTSRVVRM